MHLALIVQLSIALLAGEFAGRSDAALMPAWLGAVALLAAPAWTIARGAQLLRAAHRAMDGGLGGPERVFAFHGRAPWLAVLAMSTAALSALPGVLAQSGGTSLVLVVFAGAGIATTLATYFNGWSIERRIREATILRTLDGARPLHAMPSRAAYVLAQARAGLLPLLAPLLVPLASAEAARVAARAWWPESIEWAQTAGAVTGALLLFALIPIVVPPILGLRRLAPGELRSDLESLARDAGVGMREIWVWPTEGLVANAAVMGLFPGLRCVMLSDCLLECMPRAQVRAVMAHELGHVRRRHLQWMAGVILGCWTIAAVVATLLASEVLPLLPPRVEGSAGDMPLEIVAFARDVAALAGGLWLFGFAGRRFERQADTFAVQVLSRRDGSDTATVAAVEAMRGALASVAFLNHVPESRPSWRHGSIAWRRAYLAGLPGAPLRGMPIDRVAMFMAITLTAIAALGLVLSAGA